MRLDAERASRMVAETECFSVKEIAKRHDTHPETVRNHLRREATDPEFAELCRKKRELLRAEADRQRKEWGDATVTCLRALLGTIEAGAKHHAEQIAAGKLEKGAIRELAGAVKIVAEANLTRDTLFGSGGTAEKPKAPEPETNPVH
jgi:transposase-like protein